MKKNPFRLDSAPGPAAPLDDAKIRAMAKQIVAKSALPPWVKWGPWIGVGVGVLAIGAWLASRPHEQPNVTVAPPVTPSITAPPPTASAIESAPPVVVSASTVPPTKPPSAEDLLRTANKQRGDGQYAEAQSTYERVTSLHPGTDASYAALVASAQLRLDHGSDAKGALARFRQALAQKPDGPLAEDCRLGIADANGALGDRAAEKAALEEYVVKHSNGLAISRVKSRLAEL